jgi:choline kinase
MKAVILAAGQGTRIRQVHGERPKCLIRTGSTTILDHQIEALVKAGVRKIAVVVGYQKHQILDHLRFRRRALTYSIECLENPVFHQTNNIYSLWMARRWIDGSSFVCLNADVVFHSGILGNVLKSDAPASMIVDPEWRDETMKVVISGDRVIRMNKRIDKSAFSGTYIGITVFARPMVRKLFSRIGELIQAGRSNEFFNAALQELIDQGAHVGYSSTTGLPWAEIDDPQDLQFARKCVFPHLSPAAA